MNKELVTVKREVGEQLAKKGCRYGKIGHRGLKGKYTLGSLVETYFGQPPKQWTSGIHKGDSHNQMKLFMSKAAKFCKMKKVKAVKLG
ncbi:hypothetical protein CASFOL_011494 [Castilleja foliolosa]|uniref:Uncharacterized protein n=1 Tax=Castilleja foliolosa TaxID=1961234 RepID=A0ABD3DZT6_9LAMI